MPKIKCLKCNSRNIIKAGNTIKNKQRYRCKRCKYRFVTKDGRANRKIVEGAISEEEKEKFIKLIIKTRYIERGTDLWRDFYGPISNDFLRPVYPSRRRRINWAKKQMRGTKIARASLSTLYRIIKAKS